MTLNNNIEVVKQHDNALKVLTLNVENGLQQESYEQIQKSNADIIALQEIRKIEIDVFNTSMENLAHDLGMNYLSPSPSFVNKYGLVILSRWPILSSTYVHYEDQPSDKKRALLIMEIQTPSGIIQCFNTHLSFPVNIFARSHQVDAILEEIKLGIPTLILGDFNSPASFIDPVFNKLTRNLNDGWILGGNNIWGGRTWHADFGVLRVDYIWLNNDWVVINNSAKTFEVEDWDHKGLSLEVAVA